MNILLRTLLDIVVTRFYVPLSRASLHDPVKVEVSSKYQTVDKLLQYYLFIPFKFKEVYLVHLINEMAGNSFIIFSSTCQVRNSFFYQYQIHYVKLHPY